jgi:hypothetical protein
MPSQPKTQQVMALVTRTLGKDQLLDMVATGWTQKRLAAHVTEIVGKPISDYYICKTLQSYGDDYTQAKKAQAQYHADRVAEISDKVESGLIDPQSARISSDNRKWIASKLDPSVYGDKVAMDVQLTDVTAMHMAAMKEAMRTVYTVDKDEEAR